MALRDTIRELTRQHLDAGYSVMGQCLSAVGFVGNTLPNHPGLLELPCSDVAGPGFAVGHALSGKRPILVIRYQGFSWFNAAMIVNYAAKCKEMWGVPCPMLIRGIAMEGGIGPVAGSSHHALYYRMPGIKIFSPMTSGEWKEAYEEFMAGDDVVYLSEHRGAWSNEEETPPIRCNKPSVVLFPIGITRFAAFDAAADLRRQGILVSVYPIWKLKPLMFDSPAKWDAGLVLDDDYEDGIGQNVANKLGSRVDVIGLEDRTAGFYKDNLPPSKERIIERVKQLL